MVSLIFFRIMDLLKSFKNNRFIRGFYFLYRDYFGYSRNKFGYIADDVTLSPPLRLSNIRNIYLYGNNGLNNATILATHAKFIMKKNSGAASGLFVATGNHSMILGRFYRTIKESEKEKGSDKDVIVESDVWIGANVTLLSGIVIGRGCTVAACSVVTKSTPPYCVIAGVPAKVIKRKWTIDEIMYHESVLYPEEERFTREQLEDIYSKYGL